MICLRCGQCCIHLDIFIVNSSSILADGSIDPDDREAMIFKPAGEKCPHLVFGPEGEAPVAVCTIHHLPCYRGTPCEQFEQLGPEEAVCVMSRYLRISHSHEPASQSGLPAYVRPLAASDGGPFE